MYIGRAAVLVVCTVTMGVLVSEVFYPFQHYEERTIAEVHIATQYGDDIRHKLWGDLNCSKYQNFQRRNVDALVTSTSEYLPEKWSKECEEFVVDRDIVKFRRTIQKIEKTKLCAEQNRGAVEHGWGSTLNFLVYPYTEAFRLGLNLMAPEFDLWSNSEKCAENDLSCFFSSPVPCKEVLKILPHKNRYIEAGLTIPKEFSHRGRFWWVSNLLHYIMKPLDSISEQINDFKLSFDWGSNDLVLGLHVRHGDSCFHPDRICMPLSTYMEHVIKLREQYGFEKIFLATDDTQVVEETVNYPEFDFMILNEDLRRYEGVFNKRTFIEKTLRSGVIDGYDEAMLVTLTVMLLAECDGLVATYSSNVGRVAYSLMAMRSQSVVLRPFVSLDIPWCWDWGRSPGSDTNITC